MNKYLLKVLLLFVAVGNYVQAYHPYRVTVVLNSETALVTAPNLLDLRRDLRSNEISSLLPSYTPNSAVALDINLRGIKMDAFFDANSTVLHVTASQAGINETFAGSTREESLQLFKEYIRDGGRHHHLLRAYARYSPVDPIAGNPNSLLSQMAQADYLLGHLSPLSGCDCSWGAQPTTHLCQAGLFAGRSFSRKFDTTSVTIPARYSYSPDSRKAFIIDAPFTYLKSGGASSVVGSLGTALRIPFSSAWSLTPIFRLGFGGSLDLCTSGSFVSAGVTSAYNFKIKDFAVCMINYLGYSNSTNLWLSGVNFNYHLHTGLLKNGIVITSCKEITILNRSLSFNFTFVDSYFTRNRFYIRRYDEVGFNLITTNVNPCVKSDCASLGFSYQFGQKGYRGYNVNMLYQF